MSWKDSITQSVGPAVIGKIEDYVTRTPHNAIAPIDRFYDGTHSLLRVATPQFLTSNPTLGPLFLVGLVSLTENYFRDILSRLIGLCPIAKASAADQSINLGSVIWHGAQGIERGAFEHMSFANPDVIISSCRKFLSYKLNETQALNEFGLVCELRHGIVHSSAILGGKNAIRLQLPASKQLLQITIGFAQLQESASICNALVTSINKDLFIEMARRWAKEWSKQPGITQAERNSQFKEIWDIFHSSVDEARRAIPTPLSMVKCRNQVSRETQF